MLQPAPSADLAQLIERFHGKEEAAGLIPVVGSRISKLS